METPIKCFIYEISLSPQPKPLVFSRCWSAVAARSYLVSMNDEKKAKTREKISRFNNVHVRCNLKWETLLIWHRDLNLYDFQSHASFKKLFSFCRNMSSREHSFLLIPMMLQDHRENKIVSRNIRRWLRTITNTSRCCLFRKKVGVWCEMKKCRKHQNWSIMKNTYLLFNKSFWSI